MFDNLTPEEIETRETYDKQAAIWDQISHAHWIDDDWHDWQSRLPENALVLDIGCGTGRDADLFMQSGLRFVGIDFSPPMLKIAQDRHQGRNPDQVLFAAMNMRQLAFKEACFDGFRAVTTFMHVPRRKLLKVLWGLRKILKPGASGAISIPWGKMEDMYQGRIEGLGKTFVASWYPQELDRVLVDAGFSIKLARVDEHMLIRNVVRS